MIGEQGERLSVLIPTTGRRPIMLDRVLTAVGAHWPRAQLLTTVGRSWGAGLNELAHRATGDVWSCCCDDTIPLPGCYEAGAAILADGVEPASRYLHPDGAPLRPGWDDAPHGTETGWCRSFLLTPAMFEQVGQFIDATWYADYDYSERLQAAGYRILACDGFSFTHLDGERDWLDEDEDERQRLLYQQSRRARGLA